MTYRDRPGLAITLRILSGIFFAGMFVAVKAVSDAIPVGEIVFYRSVFAMIPLIIFLWWRRELPRGLATTRPWDHLLRAAVGALALFGSFAAVARLTLAEAILIAQLSPLIMAVAAVVFLSERLTRWRVGGLALGFAGVVVLVWPELGAADGARLTGYLIGIVAAAFAALSLIMVRHLNRTENPGAIAFYFVLASALGALLTLPWGWAWPWGWPLVLLIASGIFGGLAHIASTLAFRYAEASRIAPFEYVALLWPVLADLFIFRLPLTTTFLLAAPLVLLGAAFAAIERGEESERR